MPLESDAEPLAPPADTILKKPAVRRLTPAGTRIYEGSFSLLHCSVQGDTLYRGVYAVLLFPITYNDRFIQLCYTDEEDKAKEIGVIESLADFPPDQQALVRASLSKQYHERVITRVYDVRLEYGQLFFDVETNKGPTTFIMPWRGDRAEEHGETGKLLLDALDNRYVIPDLFALPPADRNRFTSFIYW